MSVLLFTTICWAEWPPTGIDLAKLPHPALTQVREAILKQGTTATFDEISAVATESEVRLSGKARSGRSWTVHMCSTCFDRVLRGDLDSNGVEDYVFVALAGPYGNGRFGPDGSLSFLFMDSDGMPTPFFTNTYFNEGNQGIQHLVKVDGQARLLRFSYDEIPSNANRAWGCSGHWVTQMYRFVNNTVEEVRGVALGERFPFIYNWAFNDPECVHNPVGVAQGPKLIDGMGTSSVGAVPGTPLPDPIGFALAATHDCPQAEADIVILDTRKRREIAFPNMSENAVSPIVEQMISKGGSVEVRGLHGCKAALLWGRVPR